MLERYLALGLLLHNVRGHDQDALEHNGLRANLLYQVLKPVLEAIGWFEGRVEAF